MTVSGTTDYPKGHLTQSVSKTYVSGSPGGDTVTTTESFEYDARGRLSAEQLQFGTLPTSWGITTNLPGYLAQYSFNDANQTTTTATSTNPSGQGYTTTQVYDSTTGVPTGVSNNGTATANLATMVYNARAQLDTINFQTSLGNPLASEQFGYDANIRPTSASASWQSGSGSSGTVFSQNLSYDPASNVTSLATTQAAVPGKSGSGGSESQNFCYDEQNRLVWAGNSGTQPGAGNGTCGTATLSNTLSGASYHNTYVYTHLGQLWQGPVNGTSSQKQYLYCNSQPHELTGIYSSGATCANRTTLVYGSSYDSWGNVTSRTYSSTTATLTYDLLDHFVNWNAGSSNQELYVYDASGNRVLRRTTSGSSTTMTVYAFGLEEHSYTSTGSHTSDLYYYSLAGRLLGTLDGSGNTVFTLTDTLGSVLASFNNVDHSAAITGNQVFGPYGNFGYHQGTLNTTKGFTGQYNDSLTGLDYYGSRYYDQVAGVFLSADIVQGNLQGMNPYAYVGGNPETKNDPTGQYFAPPGGGNGNGNTGIGTAPPSCIQLHDCVNLAQGSDTLSPLSGGYSKSLSLSGSTQNPNSCGQFSQADCMPIKWNALTYLTGTVNVRLSFGMSSVARLCVSGTSFCTWIPFASGQSIDIPVQVSLLTSSPLSGCATFTSCAHDTQGVDDKPTDDAAALDAGGTCSFSRTTKVATEHGKQAIDQVHQGERVLAYNPKTHKMELQPILHVWIHTDNDLVDLTITTTTHSRFSHLDTESIQASEVIHTNQKHPFFTLEQGFVPVSKITVGMHLLQADGSFGVVTGWKVLLGTQVMYNLEVAQDHTFTVGDGQWVVHNECGPSFPEDASQLSHIFRDAKGHVLDTPENRQLIIDTASNPNNFVGTDRYGVDWYTETNSDGRQVWVSVKNNVIQNAGVNNVPYGWDAHLGRLAP